MKDSTAVLDAELDYAVRMVRKGFATPEQAARVCGVKLKDVKDKLAQAPQREPQQAQYDYQSLLRAK